MAARLYLIKDCYINLDCVTFVPRITHEEGLLVAGEENPVNGFIVSVYTVGQQEPHSFVFDTEQEANQERDRLVGAAGTTPRL